MLDQAKPDTKRLPDDDTPMLDAAVLYAEHGFFVFPASRRKIPCTSSDKYPSERPRWGATRDLVKVRNNFGEFKGANIGIETGTGFFVVEADTIEGHPDLEPGEGVPALEKLVADNGGWPDTMQVISPTGSPQYWFKSPPGITVRSCKLMAGVEVKGNGSYVMVPPSIRPIAKGSRKTGRYRWRSKLKMATAPTWLIELCKEDRQRHFSNDDDVEVNVDKAVAAIDAMLNVDVDEEKYYRLMASSWSAGNGANEVKEAFNRFSHKSPKHRDRRLQQRWRAFDRHPPREIGPGTLYDYADETAPDWRDNWLDATLDSVKSNGAAPVDHEPDHPDEEEVKEEVKKEEVKPDAANSQGATSVHDDTDPVDLWNKFDPPELPTGLLPETIERYALIEGANMGCDPAGLAMAALTACAAVISDDIKLQVKEHSENWTEPARMWTALVGEPSAKKTPQISQAASPVSRIDRKLTAEYLGAKEVYDNLSAADKKLQPPPKHQQIKLEDTTIEAAQEVLKNSPNGVLCLQDELSGFFGMMDKHSGSRGAAADRAFWMKSYNGGEQKFHRIARGSGIMPNLSVNLLGGIQPDVIRKLAADGIEDGLLQRALFIMLHPASVDQDKPRDPVVADYFKLVDKLHGLLPPQRPGFDESQPWEFTVLRFDPAAQAIRNQLAEKHIKLMRCESINRKLATHVGKYDGVFARLCVLWHCIENVNETILPTLVTEDTARRVERFLHQFIFKHAVAFYTNVLGIADDHDRLRNVASYILARRLDKVTNRDIAHGDRSMRNLTDWDTLKIFEQLEALGWLERRLPKKPPQKIQWMVNPKVHVQFADRAEREKQRRDEAREAVADIFR